MTEAVSAPALKPKVAFVVDDERVIAITLATLLNHAGFDARPMFSGLDAVKASERLEPDLLITDVVMPEMTGIELAIHFRAKFSKCKILLFSGQAATVNLLEEAKSQGHEFEILAKPVHPTDLIEKLRSQP